MVGHLVLVSRRCEGSFRALLFVATSTLSTFVVVLRRFQYDVEMQCEKQNRVTTRVTHRVSRQPRIANPAISNSIKSAGFIDPVEWRLPTSVSCTPRVPSPRTSYWVSLSSANGRKVRLPSFSHCSPLSLLSSIGHCSASKHRPVPVIRSLPFHSFDVTSEGCCDSQSRREVSAFV